MTLTLQDISLQQGTCSLKYYKFWTIGLKPFNTKAKVLKAINLGLDVYRYDKTMKTTALWNGKRWENINK